MNNHSTDKIKAAY